MAKLKEFLIAHGEKAVLGVVALLCLLSILGNVARNPRAMELPGGESTVIEIGKVDEKISEIESNLQSTTAVHPPRTAPAISRSIAHKALGRKTVEPRAARRWTLYVQPPEVTVPTPWKEQPVEIVQTNIPPEFRTRFGNPVELAIRATPEGTVITVRDSEFLNYIEPGSRRYILLRKKVGFARDELNPRFLSALSRAPRTAPLSGESDAPQKGGETPEPDRPSTSRPLFGRGGGGGRTAEKQPEDSTTEKKKTGPERTEYFRQIDAVNIRAFSDMRTVMDPESRMDTAWEVLTDDMPAVRDSIRADEIASTILRDGMTHVTTYMPEPEVDPADTPEPETPIEETVEEPVEQPTHNPWGDGPTILVVEDKSKKDEKKEAKVDVGMRPDQLYTYTWLDTDIEENMVYRYAVLCTVQPRQVPKEVLTELELTAFDIYAEVNGMSPYGDFAQPESIVQPLLEEWTARKAKGVGGDFRIKFEEAYPPVSEWESMTNPMPRSLRDREGMLTELGRAYRRQESCYSDIVYSDLVLIPVEQQISVVSATEGTVSMRVTVTTPNGETQSRNFFVESSSPVPPILPTDWLEKEEDEEGNMVVKWPDYRILSPEEVYQDRVGTAPVQIGEVVRVGRDEFDFSTNWAVIDVRRFQTIRHTERLDRDGNWVPTTPGVPVDQWCVIVREVNVPEGRSPRVRRMYRQLPEPTSDRIRYRYEHIFEPETMRYIEERKARGAGRSGGR